MAANDDVASVRGFEQIELLSGRVRTVELECLEDKDFRVIDVTGGHVELFQLGTLKEEAGKNWRKLFVRLNPPFGVNKTTIKINITSIIATTACSIKLDLPVVNPEVFSLSPKFLTVGRRRLVITGKNLVDCQVKIVEDNNDFRIEKVLSNDKKLVVFVKAKTEGDLTFSVYAPGGENEVPSPGENLKATFEKKSATSARFFSPPVVAMLIAIVLILVVFLRLSGVI